MHAQISKITYNNSINVRDDLNETGWYNDILKILTAWEEEGLHHHNVIFVFYVMSVKIVNVPQYVVKMFRMFPDGFLGAVHLLRRAKLGVFLDPPTPRHALSRCHKHPLFYYVTLW